MLAGNYYVDGCFPSLVMRAGNCMQMAHTRPFSPTPVVIYASSPQRVMPPQIPGPVLQPHKAADKIFPPVPDVQSGGSGELLPGRSWLPLGCESDLNEDFTTKMRFPETTEYRTIVQDAPLNTVQVYYGRENGMERIRRKEGRRDGVCGSEGEMEGRNKSTHCTNRLWKV